MNRRDFLKALSALVGSAAAGSTFAKYLPEKIPDSWVVSIVDASGSVEVPIASVTVADITADDIVFPMATRSQLATHVRIIGLNFSECAPLLQRMFLCNGVTPMFLAGALQITED